MASDTVTSSPARIVAPLHHDAEAVDREILRHVAEMAPRQKLERGFRRLVGVAGRLAGFDVLEQDGDARVVLADDEAELLEARQHVGSPGLLRDQKAALVADRFRAARARRSAAPSGWPRRGYRPWSRTRFRPHRAHAGSALGSGSRPGCGSHA